MSGGGGGTRAPNARQAWLIYNFGQDGTTCTNEKETSKDTERWARYIEGATRGQQNTSEKEGTSRDSGRRGQREEGRGRRREAGRGRERKKSAEGKETICETAVQGQAIVTGLMAFESQPRVQLYYTRRMCIHLWCSDTLYTLVCARASPPPCPSSPAVSSSPPHSGLPTSVSDTSLGA